MTICAEHLVYARVEPNLSPRRTAGYQTVWYSNGLLQEKRRSIEEIVGCPIDEGEHRLQFFQIGQGDTVITWASPLTVDREMVDRAGRRCFMTHAIVLKQKDFLRLGANPFQMIDMGSFFQDLQTPIQRYGPCRSMEPLYFSQDSVVEVRQARGKPSEGMLQAAFEAKNLTDENKFVFFQGGESEVRDYLRRLFIWLPSEYRLDATFTTKANDCPFFPGLFWGIGADRINPQPKGQCEQLERLKLWLPPLKQTSRVYLNWVNRRGDEASSEVMNGVTHIARFLEGDVPTLKVTIAPEILAEVAAHEPERLKKKYSDLISPYFSRSTSRQMIDWLVAQSTSWEPEVLCSLCRGDFRVLGNKVFQWMQQHRHYPLFRGGFLLSHLASRAPLLQFLMKSKDILCTKKSMMRAVSELTDAELDLALTLMPGSRPRFYIIKSFVDRILSSEVLSCSADGDLIKIARNIGMKKLVNELDAVVPRLRELGRPHKESLRKLLQIYPETPDHILEALLPVN